MVDFEIKIEVDDALIENRIVFSGNFEELTAEDLSSPGRLMHAIAANASQVAQLHFSILARLSYEELETEWVAVGGMKRNPPSDEERASLEGFFDEVRARIEAGGDIGRLVSDFLDS